MYILKLYNFIIFQDTVESFDLKKQFDRNDFISLLFYNGYITIKDTGVRYKFKIPNYVTEILYAMYFLSITDRKSKYKADTTAIEEGMQELAYVYAEYPAGQGFADLYIQKSANSVATYEAIVELKYLKKKDEKDIDLTKLEEEAKEQLNRYMQDKRLQGKENLKKYMIIFKGFEDYIIKDF